MTMIQKIDIGGKTYRLDRDGINELKRVAELHNIKNDIEAVHEEASRMLLNSTWRSSIDLKIVPAKDNAAYQVLQFKLPKNQNGWSLEVFRIITELMVKYPKLNIGHDYYVQDVGAIGLFFSLPMRY